MLSVPAIGRGDWRIVHDLPGLYRRPLVPGGREMLAQPNFEELDTNVPLDPNAEGKQRSADDYGLDTHLLPIVHLWFRCPVQELHHIFCHL